jgi:hypothetical protein
LSVEELPAGVATEVERLLEGEFKYLQLDPVLGWSQQSKGASGLYEANGQGLRGSREYAPTPIAEITRIATFGDSFTHGDDVPAAGTWQVALESELVDGEVLNFGVPAFGPGQAYLRYQGRGREFAPNVVLIGFMAENIQRAINVWRPFYRSNYSFPLTKPRFVVEQGQLELISNPLTTLQDYKRLLEVPESVLPLIALHDSQFKAQYVSSPFDLSPALRLSKLLRYAFTKRNAGVLTADGAYNTSHEAFGVVCETLAAFSKTVSADGALPLIIVFPNEILAKGSRQGPAYQPLLAWLKDQRLDHVDLQGAFDRYLDGPVSDELRAGSNGHYSAKANAMVAHFLRDELTNRGWAKPRK